MDGPAFHERPAGLVKDSMTELDADLRQFGYRDFHREYIIVASRPAIAQPGFNHGQDNVRLLQSCQGLAGVPEEFATRLLEDIQVTGVVDMIADRAFGVGDPVL